MATATHPLSRTLTRARDAGDALRALVLLAARTDDAELAATLAALAADAERMTRAHSDQRVRCAAGRLRRALSDAPPRTSQAA